MFCVNMQSKTGTDICAIVAYLTHFVKCQIIGQSILPSAVLISSSFAPIEKIDASIA